MTKVPTGPGVFEFQLRPGVDPLGGSGWRGVNTEADPGSIAPNELQWGENIRLTGKGIRSRSGLTKVLDLGTAAGSIYHFGPLPVDNPRTRLWLTALAVYNSDTAAIRTGSSVYHLDPTEDPVFQTHSRFFSAAGSIALLAKYGEKLYVGERDTLKELVDITAPPGLNLVDVSPTPAAIPIAQFTGYTIRAVKEFDGKLFISLENNTTITSSKVVVWDGLGVTEDLTGVRPVQAFGIWRDKLVAGFDATAANIRVRDSGAAPGTWVTYALAGFSCALTGNAMAEYGPYIYIASGVDLLFRFNGSSLTLVRTIATCGTAALTGCNALTLHNGLLYYGWNEDGTEAAKLGRHDYDSTAANEYVDTYKDLNADQPNFKRLTALASYRGQVWAGGQQMWVVATAINDVKGTVEVVNSTGTPTEDFRVVGFTRFP